MTKAELIKALEQYPDEIEVVIANPEWDEALLPIENANIITARPAEGATEPKYGKFWIANISDTARMVIVLR
jgi:hypothetical protein